MCNCVLVEGCSDPDLPAAMWIRRDIYEALVGCKIDTPTRWILKCVNGIWDGQVGICPSAPGQGSASALLPSFGVAPALSSIPAKPPKTYLENGQYSTRLP